MKRTVYFFFALLSLLFSTQPSKAQQAFYIYRNDGVINAFVTTEIDSMTYSRLDADSLMHDDYVVQEVYTPDSIYRIPIEKIDSVGFVTPETKYQPGVTVLEGKLRSYIVSCEGLTLTFRSDIPNSLLPRKGDKLVSTESDEYLESAFLGEVASVRDVTDGIEVVCEPVTLTDVFECYYGVVQNDEQQQTRGIKDGFYSTNGYKTFTPGRLTHNMFRSFEYEKSDELSFSLNNAEASISLTPEIKCSGFLIVNKEYGINISLSIIGNYFLEEYFALCGSVGLKKDIPLIKAKLPIKQILLDLILEIGLFGELSGELATEQKFSQEYRHVFNWNWSSKGASTLKNTNEFKPISGTYSGIVALDGHVRVGAYGKIGAEFIATKDLDIAEIDLRADGGWSLEGSFVPYKKDLEFAKKNTDLYKMIKDKNIGIYWFYGLSGEAKLFKWSISHEVPNICGIPLNRKEPIKELRVVPLFADTKLEKDDSGKYFASTKASGNVGKTELGMALVNRKNSDDATYTYLVQDYKGPEFKLNTSFSNMSADAEYIAYPLVKYLDMELLAEPSSDPQKTYIFPYIFYQKNAAGSMIGGSSVYDSFKGEESTYVITNDKNTVKESLK